jgi:septal ring factor EnvC (AmiA/AmiB activator)
MSDSTHLHNSVPLQLERVQSSRSAAGEIRLRLSGRWSDPQAAVSEDEELLVVNVEGRRHRFPVSRDEAPDPDRAPDRWTASFTVPTWAEPREEGQAALWLGTAVIPVPPLLDGGERVLPPPPADRAHPGPGSEPLRSGPLADVLLKETVAALHAELEQRTEDTATIRGALADVQADLEARVARHAQLEETLGDLRDELDRLRTGLQEQRGELQERSSETQALREQLAAAEEASERRVTDLEGLQADLAVANVSREAADSEAQGLRSEIERLGSELAVTRERVEHETGDLGEASRLLADARALADELRAGGDGG